jgi:hypothetical protein
VLEERSRAAEQLHSSKVDSCDSEIRQLTVTVHKYEALIDDHKREIEKYRRELTEESSKAGTKA